MKTFAVLSMFILAFVPSMSQDYMISFTGSGESATVDSVDTENLSRGTRITLSGSRVLHLRVKPNVISPVYMNREFRVYPNPSQGICKAEFFSVIPGKAVIEVFDLAGKLAGRSQFMLKEGKSVFTSGGLNSGWYTVRILSPEF